jgi:hypothetical protein
MDFSWDKRLNWLWCQGIDLIGDDGCDDVGEGIANGTMFGQSEGGELLDVTDNGFDDVAPVEQRPYCNCSPHPGQPLLAYIG